MGELTTIALRKTTVNKLQKFRQYRRETYDDLLNSLMAVIDFPWSDDEGELTEETKLGILRGMQQMAEGKGIAHKELMKQLGVK